MRSLDIASTGMLAQQLNVEVISNNIANMNTTGYKRARAEFQDLLYQTVARPGAETGGFGQRRATGIQIGTGVETAGVYRINEQGNLNATGGRFDLAIDGRGFLRVEMPTGEDAFTRAGSLQVSAEGDLVTPDGYRVLPGATIPEDALEVVISEAGAIQVRRAGETELVEVGEIELASFQNEAGLNALGANLVAETEASGIPIFGLPGEPGFGTLRQGFLETSNVNPVAEITSLITAQRAYEMNSRVIQTADEMMTTLGQIR
ncbi:MAG: flagellar basal-body rod protein FlgG [Pseudomonadota bacterium]